MYVVGLAVELHQLGAQRGAGFLQYGLAVGEHGVVEDPAPVLGHEHQVGVQQRHAVPGTVVVGLLGHQDCRSSVLRSLL